jgi:hypothetical protein
MQEQKLGSVMQQNVCAAASKYKAVFFYASKNES